MKKIALYFCLATLAFGAELKPKDFDGYLESFDVKEIKNMKISSIEMLELVKNDKAILIDVRFAEEFKAWNMPFAKNIPLNELPNRLSELPTDKLIITACPHNDRANMARVYLTMKGYDVKYLNDGLLKVTDYLKGGVAVEYMRDRQGSR